MRFGVYLKDKCIDITGNKSAHTVSTIIYDFMSEIIWKYIGYQFKTCINIVIEYGDSIWFRMLSFLQHKVNGYTPDNM
jgi:hypothetical protein